MPPHKSKARAHQQPPPPSLPPPQPSDYETDAPPAALDVPLPPPRSNEELNFSVLKRSYPDLLAIEHVAPYAALYTFNIETEQWEKVGVEGTLFVCQLTPSPMGAERYCVIILNRRGLENFYVDLVSEEDLEVSDPFIILQGEQVYGFWVFADPAPASTANCRIDAAEKLSEVANKARVSHDARHQAAKNGVNHVHQQEDASSVPMGRQLSLRELFGQQREQDSGYSVHTHNGPPPQDPHMQQHGYPSMPAAAPPAQQDVLGQLFMKAKQDYNGLG